MYNYIPFLKLKVSEISALKELTESRKTNLIPFFDFPRKKPKKSRYKKNEDVNKNTLFNNDLNRLESKFNKNLKWINQFYLDNYDVEDEINIDKRYHYFNIIEKFSKLGMIPVLALDRHPDHLSSVIYGFKNGLFKHKRAAIRLTKDYFCSYSLFKREIDDILNSLSVHIDFIDFIFDCRVCKKNDSSKLSNQIINFIHQLEKTTPKISLGKIVTTGSMIPASISELIDTQSEMDILREEIKIYNDVISVLGETHNINLGDYSAVSPDYSDIELFDEDMQNITTAKIFYPYSNRLFIKRGKRVKGDKYQYNKFADYIVNSCKFYRNKDYSEGDFYLHQKSNYEGSSVTAASIVKPLVNLHLSYMIFDSNK